MGGLQEVVRKLVMDFSLEDLRTFEEDYKNYSNLNGQTQSSLSHEATEMMSVLYEFEQNKTYKRMLRRKSEDIRANNKLGINNSTGLVIPIIWQLRMVYGHDNPEEITRSTHIQARIRYLRI